MVKTRLAPQQQQMLSPPRRLGAGSADRAGVRAAGSNRLRARAAGVALRDLAPGQTLFHYGAGPAAGECFVLRGLLRSSVTPMPRGRRLRWAFRVGRCDAADHHLQMRDRSRVDCVALGQPRGLVRPRSPVQAWWLMRRCAWATPCCGIEPLRMAQREWPWLRGPARSACSSWCVDRPRPEDRVPHRMIASYPGMTPNFSRPRNAAIGFAPRV